MQTNQEIIVDSNKTPLPEISSTSPREPGIFIEKRRLTPTEAERLHQELKSTANILGYTVPELLRFSEVLIASVVDDAQVETFAGVSLCKDLLWRWTEISVIYVLPEFRGRGISSQLFTTAFNAAQERKRHIYTLSRSPEVIHLMKKSGMVIGRSLWNAPLAVRLEMDRHMMSLYRWREAGRKMAMRRTDGYEFHSGIKRV